MLPTSTVGHLIIILAVLVCISNFASFYQVTLNIQTYCHFCALHPVMWCWRLNPGFNGLFTKHSTIELASYILIHPQPFYYILALSPFLFFPPCLPSFVFETGSYVASPGWPQMAMKLRVT